MPRTALVRLGLAILSGLVAVACTSWSRSLLPVGARLCELALCVLAWEASVALCGVLPEPWIPARIRLYAPAGSPLRLAVTVVAASLPATAGMVVAFGWVGEPLAAPFSLYGQSLILGLLLAFARRGLLGGTRRTHPPGPVRAEPAVTAAPVGEPPVHALLRRHAPSLAGRRLLALEAEDHYLRLHTDGGSALVLMRLRDAVAALGPDAGWQPHRSFWLPTGVAARVERTGQGWTLRLQCGLAVPVSGANVGRMRDAGYLPASRRDGPGPCATAND